MKYYVNNSFSHMQALKGGQLSLKYPLKLYLDITEDCNMSCIMCRDQLSVCGKTMSMDLFTKIVDETADFVSSYSLFNWGEPLLVKDFRERVLYLKSKMKDGTTIDISTNGSLLNQDMINFLADNEIIVTVSFDGSDKGVFEQIRRGGRFESICRNLENLAKAYEGHDIDFIPGIYTSIQKNNQHQLLDIAKLIKDMGIYRMGFGLVVNPKEFQPQLSEELRNIIRETKIYIDRNGMINDLYPTKVGDFLWDGEDFYHESGYIVDKSCNAPFVNASIAYNGDVYLCCNVGEYVDNVCDKTFYEIWIGEKYELFRLAVNDPKTMPERCKDCPWFNR